MHKLIAKLNFQISVVRFLLSKNVKSSNYKKHGRIIQTIFYYFKRLVRSNNALTKQKIKKQQLKININTN